MVEGSCQWSRGVFMRQNNLLGLILTGFFIFSTSCYAMREREGSCLPECLRDKLGAGSREAWEGVDWEKTGWEDENGASCTEEEALLLTLLGRKSSTLGK